MKTLANREGRVLESARRALGPGPKDLQRVRDRLAAAIASGALPTVTIPDDVGPLGSAEPGGVSTLSALTEVPTKLVAGGLLIGGLGFGAGYAVGRADVPQAEQPRVAPMAQPSAAPRPTSAAPEPTAVRRGAASEPEQQTDRREPKSSSANGSPSTESSSTPRRSSGNLAEEVELMTQAQRALRAGDHETALRLLDDLSRRFPNGALSEEREAAQVLAMCGANPGKRSAQRARAFLKTHRGSVYAARIRAACAEPAGGQTGNPVRPGR